MKNIIDILRKGNLELFHSSLIGWLLDPKGEHGLKEEFLTKFLQDAKLLEVFTSNDLQEAKVCVEAVDKKNRYDIEIKIGRKSVIIENKIKSIGYELQLENYSQKDTYVIGLGQSEMSFEKIKNRNNFTFLNYLGIKDILDKLNLSQTQEKYKVLINEYKSYLSSELKLIRFFQNPNSTELKSIIDEFENRSLNQNDERFLLLNFLWSFREEKNLFGWELNKNMISGVWLANYKEEIVFNDRVNSLLRNHKNSLWFHIEFYTGLSWRIQENEEIGTIQLRSSNTNTKNYVNSDFYDSFKNEFRDGIKDRRFSFPKRPSKNYSSFCLIRQSLIEENFSIDGYSTPNC